MITVVLLGPPGAGKGTLAQTLRDRINFTHFSTGDMLREAIQQETPLGLRIKDSMAKGEFASDEVVLEMVKDRIVQDQRKHNYLFDGFPRTMHQAEMLDTIMDEVEGNLAHVLNMTIPDELAIKRLTGRRTCKTCGWVSHIHNVRPTDLDHCDRDDCEIYQRPDDNEQTVRDRLVTYHEITAPLIRFYREKDLIRDIDASISSEQTCAEALNVMNI